MKRNLLIFEFLQYLLQSRMLDVVEQFAKATPQAVVEVPQKFELVGQGKSGQKSDVYQFGAIALAAALGSEELGISLGIPDFLDRDLCDFLHRCLCRQQEERWAASQLLGHRFLSRNSKEKKESQENFKQPKEIPVADSIDFASLAAPGPLGFSRLQSEFEVLKYLGEGGFGDVIKVKNKLDGQIYALKRILLNPKSIQLNRKITREVKLLSRLNHENVVRYYHAWIEAIVEPEPTTETDESSMTKTPTEPEPRTPTESEPQGDTVEIDK